MKRISSCTLLLIVLLTVGCAATFVPRSYDVPEQHQLPAFAFTRLTQAHAAMDYEAVMESRHELRLLFGGDWPADSFSLEENMADLALHESLFSERTSFTYTIVNSNGSRVLGCMYINPTDSAGYEAQVHLWVRTSEAHQAAAIRNSAVAWLDDNWPFDRVLYHW
ncbi:MAG: GNAT family N-acetyltransferase [Bacteroidota bacterium]